MDAGLADQVRHKLRAYRWYLADRFEADLLFVVTEIQAFMRESIQQKSAAE